MRGSGAGPAAPRCDEFGGSQLLSSGLSGASLPSSLFSFRGSGQEMRCTCSICVCVPIWCRQDRQRGCRFPMGCPGRVTRSRCISQGLNLETALRQLLFLTHTWAQRCARAGGGGLLRGCGDSSAALGVLSPWGGTGCPTPALRSGSRVAEQHPMSLQKVPAVAEQPTPRHRLSLYKLHRQPGLQ